MKKTHHLISLAQKLSNKYAESQTLQEIIEAAAGYGESSPNGIMDFPSQLKQDKAELSMGIVIQSGPLGGKKVLVGTPSVYPPEVASHYSKLPEQIKKYLDKNIKYFPQIGMGTYSISYPQESEGNGNGIAAN